MIYFGDLETKIEWWWWSIPLIVKKLHGGCSNGGGDDDGERVWIKSDTLGYDVASDLQHQEEKEEEGKKDLMGLNANAVINWVL